MTVEIPELKKYNKRIDDLIEIAEIEAELEAENRIRSKNTRLILISIISLIIMIMIFLGINSKSDDTFTEKKSQILKPTDPNIPKPKPIPFPLTPKNKEVTDQKLLPFATKPSTSQLSPVRSKTSKVNITKSLKRPAKNPKPAQGMTKQSLSKPAPSTDYFIQIGAFSVKENAESLAKKLKTKGLSPSIESSLSSTGIFSVFVGEYKDKKSGQYMETELQQAGFSPEIKAYDKGLYSFTLGRFKTHQSAQNLISKLSKKGFLPGLRRIKSKAPIFIVSVGKYGTLKEAISAQIKIKTLGFTEAFPKKIG